MKERLLEVARLGGGRTVDAGVHQELDEALNPVARALVPANASELSVRHDGDWWAVMDAWVEEPYVVRLTFTGGDRRPGG